MSWKAIKIRTDLYMRARKLVSFSRHGDEGVEE